MLYLTPSYAQDANLLNDSRLEKKNTLTYDISSAIDYSPINISYERILRHGISLTSSFGRFHTTQSSNANNTITTSADLQLAENCWLVNSSPIGNSYNYDDIPKSTVRETNQKGQYYSLGLRIYPARLGKSHSKIANFKTMFYLEPQWTLYNYKADHGTTTNEIGANDDFYRGSSETYTVIAQIYTVTEEQRNYSAMKMNCGWRILTKKRIAFEVAVAAGILMHKEGEKWANTNPFGNSLISGNKIFDLKLKAGYNF